MKMQILRVGLIILLSLVVGTANAARQLEYADEGPVVAFYLGKDLTGYVKTKQCDDCKVVMYKIHKDVKAMLDGKAVPLSNFILSTHKPAGVYFDLATQKMKRLVWFSKREQ